VLNILRRKADLTPASGIMNDGIDWEEMKRVGIDRFNRLVLKKGK
jgi:hypothetical protein